LPVVLCLIALAALLAGCVAPVPDVRGMPVASATKAIQSAGLVLGPVTRVSHPSAPVGTVVRQVPSAGGSASKYSEVALAVSTGPESPRVPDVIGRTEADAVTAIEDAGFTLTASRVSDNAASGTVIAQKPTAGKATSGDTVDITISVGAHMVRVPDIHGIIDPDPTLAKAGLKGAVIAVHGPIEPDAAGIGEAYRQRPSAGAWVPQGTTVSYHSWWESQ
jgi:serine/threonine-protein kinase